MFNRCNDMSDAETCLAPLHLLIQGNVSEDAVYCEYWTNHANCLAPITSLIIMNIVKVGGETHLHIVMVKSDDNLDKSS